MKIDVLLADDHLIFLEAMKKLLEPFCRVVGTASDGQSVIPLAEELRPSVIVLDVNLPLLNGLDSCERILKRVPESKIIFLTVSEDLDTAEEAIRRGAFGYVLKKSASAELFKAIQYVSAGRIYVTPVITQEPMSVFVARAKRRVTQRQLTARQREVLQLLVEGKSMKEAADVLKVTPRTIAFHKYTMMQSLGVKRTSELLHFAAQSGLRPPSNAAAH